MRRWVRDMGPETQQTRLRSQLCATSQPEDFPQRAAVEAASVARTSHLSTLLNIETVCWLTMPGPVVSGVRQSGALGSPDASTSAAAEFLPLMAEGSIRLLLLTSGDILMARLRNTTDRDGQPAYQLIRPRRVTLLNDRSAPPDQPTWRLDPYLNGLTTQRNVVLFKTALASVLEPDSRLVQAYAEETVQECPLEETPVERLKRAFQEFTESIEAEKTKP